MPYTENDAPEYVKKLPAKKRRQWLHVFNSAIASGDSEESAFKQANAIAASERGVMLDVYDIDLRRELPMYVNYEPLRGNSERACAACRWFISPNSCVVVRGDIAPTGLCDLYRAAQVQVLEPTPVTLVESHNVRSDENSGGGTLFDKIKSLFSHAPPVHRELMFYSLRAQDDGALRFFLRVSNNFKDRTNWIISEAAHREYVDWVDETKSYPELWVWHTMGSRLGVADWLDVCNGVLCASGLIDRGRESVAKDLMKVCDGTSHGFFYIGKDVANGTREIVKYRTYELSILPKSYAANNMLDAGVRLVSEDVMPFSPAKRDLLAKYFGDEEVSRMERDTDAMVESLRTMGIEYKEVEEPTAVGVQLSAMTRAVADLTSTLSTKFAAIEERLSAAEKAITSGVEEAMTPAVQNSVGFSAASSETTVVDDKDPVVVAAGKRAQSPDWFSEKVMGAIGLRFE